MRCSIRERTVRKVEAEVTLPKIIFIEANGAEHPVEADLGRTVMEAALKHAVPGIDADCGGSCSCATCHVYVDDAWVPRVGGRNDMEGMMLEFAEAVEPSSRLSCQIQVTPDLDGLMLRLPLAQR